MARRARLEIDVELQGQGRIYFDEANQISDSGYAVVNLRAGVRRARWGLHGYARNAGNAEYATVIAPGFFQVPGAPRRFGVSLSIHSQ